jgi:hypothetical protein
MQNAIRQASPQRNTATFTQGQFRRKFFALGRQCYYCQCALTLETAEREHRVPICRGGSDSIANIVPACRDCNRKKGWRTEREFEQERVRLSAFSKNPHPPRGESLTAAVSAAPSQKLSLEEKYNEPFLLKKLVNERETGRWWRTA